jgi:hypothetical protein
MKTGIPAQDDGYNLWMEISDGATDKYRSTVSLKDEAHFTQTLQHAATFIEGFIHSAVEIQERTQSGTLSLRPPFDIHSPRPS